MTAQPRSDLEAENRALLTKITELDAEADNAIATVAALTMRLSEIDALRPPCPTCGGKGELNKPVLVPSNEVAPGARFYLTTPCPENGGNCDGKVSIEQLAATWRAVQREDFDGDTHDSWRSAFLYLRAVKP